MLNATDATPRDLESIARSGGIFRRIAVRIPTYLTDLRESPSWLPMFLLARTMPFRNLHWMTAKSFSPSGSATPSMFGNLEAEPIAQELKRTGIFTGLKLPREVHEKLARFGCETPCFGNFERGIEFLPSEHAEAERRFGRTILSGHHFERVMRCEAAIAVQRDPLLLDIARYYLGGQAKLITTRTWWSFPTKSATESDLSRASFKYHFDLDDWRMLKFFFYLSDVDADSGPHVYVRGSHRHRRLKHQLTLLVGHPAEEVVDSYGEENIMTLTGEAGLGFVEDPFGFHMGTLARKTPRLMMEVGFGVSKPSKRRYHGEPVIR